METNAQTIESLSRAVEHLNRKVEAQAERLAEQDRELAEFKELWRSVVLDFMTVMETEDKLRTRLEEDIRELTTSADNRFHEVWNALFCALGIGTHHDRAFSAIEESLFVVGKSYPDLEARLDVLKMVLRSKEEHVSSVKCVSELCEQIVDSLGAIHGNYAVDRVKGELSDEQRSAIFLEAYDELERATRSRNFAFIDSHKSMRELDRIAEAFYESEQAGESGSETGF